MDLKQLLSEAAALTGPSGHEGVVSTYFAEQFRPLVDEVKVDAMYNVLAHRKGTGPRIMLCAHLDEVALMVSAVEKDGSLRVTSVGGLDWRILPGTRVWVHGRERLFGVIGTIPTRLKNVDDRSKACTQKELFVDLGLPGDMVRTLVNVGDIITFDCKPVTLSDDLFACKTMDDRACVAMLLRTAERLARVQCDADAWFVASSQ